MIVSHLTGKIDQLTIFGQIEFILGNDYECSNLVINKDIITKVSGCFRVLDTNDIERLEITLTPQQYIQHHKMA